MSRTLELASVAGLIVDMDGVLWIGDRAAPGLLEFFGAVRGLSIDIVLATNNSSRAPEDYRAKLARMGVAIPTDRILTSAMVAADWLKSRLPAGAAVHMLGQEGLRVALVEAGFDVGSGPLPVGAAAEAVVVGIDFDLTYEKLKAATLLVRRGALLVGTNPDRSFPMEDGFAPGAGAILAAVEAATGVRATVIGKPGTLLFEAAIDTLGVERDCVAVVGDQLATDIAGGADSGLATILVATGVDSAATLESSPVRPDAVFDDVGALGRALRASAASAGGARGPGAA